jgi:hypothetical protein
MSPEVIAALTMVAIGAVLTVRCVLDVLSAVLSHRWPRTTGTIIASEVERSRDVEGGVSYRAHVTYRYVVDGRELEASRIRFGDRLEVSWSAPAAGTVGRYPVGTAVSVRYNPHDPKDAVLEPGINGLLLGSAVVAVPFLAVGLGC